MTYCVGWRYEGAAYLLGDTAVSHWAAPQSPRSSFGEQHAHVRGQFVEESLLKLVPIASRCAVAYAGDVALAAAIIGFMKTYYASESSLDSLVQRVAASFGPFEADRTVELIIADARADTAELARWSTRDLNLQRNAEYFEIGSVRTFHSDITKSILSVLSNGGIEKTRLLATAAGVVQSYGVHDNMIEQNVGGVVFGLRIDKDGLQWQEDTSYLLYDRKLTSIGYVSALVRDDVLVVNSSYTNETRVFAHSVSLGRFESWQQRWSAHCREHFNTALYRYWIFIGIEEKNITVIRRQSFEEPSNLFTLTYNGDGRFDVGISPVLHATLVEPLKRGDPDVLPFRLNFRNG